MDDSVVLRVCKNFPVHYLYDPEEMPENKILRDLYRNITCPNEGDDLTIDRALSRNIVTFKICITRMHDHESKDLDYNDFMKHFDDTMRIFGKTLPKLSAIASNIVSCTSPLTVSPEPYEILLVDRIEGNKNAYSAIYVGIKVFSSKSGIFSRKKTQGSVNVKFIYRMLVK